MSKGDFAEGTVVAGRKAVAKHFGVTERSIYRWEKAGMPVLPNERYDLVQIALWLDKKGGKGGGSREKGSKDEAERLNRLKADMAELKLQERRGELIELVELEALLAPRAMAYRQGLVSLEQILSPRLAAALGLPPESMRAMNAVIRQATREVLANVLRALTLSGGQVLEWEMAEERELNDPTGG